MCPAVWKACVWVSCWINFRCCRGEWEALCSRAGRDLLRLGPVYRLPIPRWAKHHFLWSAGWR